MNRRGKQVEYLQPPKDENFPLDVEMGDAMGPCRICVVRKRDTRPDGSVRLVTSIWSLSDDGTVRMQQKRKVPSGECFGLTNNTDSMFL